MSDQFLLSVPPGNFWPWGPQIESSSVRDYGAPSRASLEIRCLSFSRRQLGAPGGIYLFGPILYRQKESRFKWRLLSYTWVLTKLLGFGENG